ncbi:MAG: CBS domain-containing protein [Nitrospirae bacterium]|nr:CBS domain-containing protein [Nitrospirota bacterium]
MEEQPGQCNIESEDIEAAIREMKAYVDVTEADLMAIYKIALRHARERLASKIAVSEIMTRDVITVKSDSDIHEASLALSEHNISGLPVVDDNGRVIGVVSEADILSMAGLARGHRFRDVLKHILGEPLPTRKEGDKVADFMTTPAITTTANADIRDVSMILIDKRIKRLPVVDDSGRLIGIISRSNILKAQR